MIFSFDFQDKYLKINCNVLAVVAKTLLKYANQINHCFSVDEPLQESDYNRDKFYDDFERIGRLIISNRDKCAKCLLKHVIRQINMFLIKYGSRSECLSKVLTNIIREFEKKRIILHKQQKSKPEDCLEFANFSLKIAWTLALRFIKNLPYNSPPRLKGKIVIKDESSAFAIAIRKDRAPFPRTNYDVHLNIINKSFKKSPLSHFMALEIIFMHELLGHIFAFSDRIEFFSDGVMRYTPYKYYRIICRSKYGVWKSFDTINYNHFFNLKGRDAYWGFKFSQELCEQFINVKNFFKLIQSMAFEAIQFYKFSSLRDYDNHILGILSDLRRIFNSVDITALEDAEDAIENSNDIGELAKLLHNI